MEETVKIPAAWDSERSILTLWEWTAQLSSHKKGANDRIGKGSKVHAVTTKEGIPLCSRLSRGNMRDSKLFFELLGDLKLHDGRRDKPKSKPAEVAADI